MTKTGGSTSMLDTATAVVYEGPGDLSIREFPIPTLEAGELIVEVELCGVDGTEVHIVNGEMERVNAKAPLIIGDEIIGRVVAIGDAARRARGVEVGDRVTVEVRWPCAANCRGCAGGNYFLCESLASGVTGRHGYAWTSLAEAPGLWGGYATHVFVPENALVYKVPEALPLKTALFACSVLANGVRWATEAGATEGKTVVVIGPGPQGLACVIAAARAGAKVVSVGLERDAARLEAARAAGAAESIAISPGEEVEETIARIRQSVGYVDVVIEAAGVPAAKQLAYGVVSTYGTVANVSIATPTSQAVDWMALLRREVTIKNLSSHAHAVPASLALAEELLRDGYDVGDLVTHVFGLREVEHAINVAAYRTAEAPVKVALDPAL